MNNLRNKTALVTGGASGIGKAITLELSALGADIIIHYYSSKDSAVELVKQIEKSGQNIMAVQADLTNIEDIKNMFNVIKDKFNMLDILINNTGDLVARVDYDKIDYEYYKKVMAVNLDSMVFTTREAIPLLKKNKDGASIINISSVAGRQFGGNGALLYSIAKGAVLTFTRNLAKSLAQDRIRVNSICPGFILGSKLHEIHTNKDKYNDIIENIPLRRAGTCQDVARAAAFLASEYNGFITGISFDINGGVYMS